MQRHHEPCPCECTVRLAVRIIEGEYQLVGVPRHRRPPLGTDPVSPFAGDVFE
jgi:hypothetical protein